MDINSDSTPCWRCGATKWPLKGEPICFNCWTIFSKHQCFSIWLALAKQCTNDELTSKVIRDWMAGEYD